jgi:hypothetical protein
MHDDILEVEVPFGVWRHKQGPGRSRRVFIQQKIELLDQFFCDALNARGRRC